MLERSTIEYLSETHAVTAGMNLWNSNEIVMRELERWSAQVTIDQTARRT